MPEPGSLTSTDQVLDGHAAVGDIDLTGFRSLVAELGQILSDLKARRRRFDHQNRDAARSRLGVRVRLDEDGEDRGMSGIRDPRLCAVYDVDVTLAAGGRGDPLQVGP